MGDPLLPSTPAPERAPAESRHRAPGFTLLELLFVLLLLSPLLGTALPRLGELRDLHAVRGAREAAVGLLLRARTGALVHGGATLLATEAPPRLELMLGGRPSGAVDLDEEFGVALSLSGRGGRRLLRFDALGLGRMTGATLRFSRGSKTAALTVSSYGRIRRW